MAESIDGRVKQVLESKRHCNILVDLLEELHKVSGSARIVLIESLTTVFEVFISRKLWHSLYEQQLVTSSNEFQREDVDISSLSTGSIRGQECPATILDAEKKFASWVQKQYVVFVNFLLELIVEREDFNSGEENIENDDDLDSRLVALGSLFRIIKADSLAVTDLRGVKGKPYFAGYLLTKVITALLDEQRSDDQLILTGFIPLLRYADVQHHTLECIHKILDPLLKMSNTSVLVPLHFSLNLLLIMENVVLGDDKEYFLLISDEENPSDSLIERFNAKYKSKAIKSAFSKAWLCVLRLNHGRSIIKRILKKLHTKVMPHLEDPRLLLDFLTDCYNSSGITSILALNGLFILIQKFNLDYPEFYKKLYNLMVFGILDVKYKERFFGLTDLFLTSTHLPAYLVAAFIKRLARISLTASPHGACLGIRLIHNLIKRHPSCKILLHRRTIESSDEVNNKDQTEHDLDVYDVTQEDPAKSRALESSLWELKTLEEHYHHSVFTALQDLKQPITKEEHNLSNLYEASYFNLMEVDMADAEEEDVPMNFVKSNALFDNSLYSQFLIK